VSPIEFLVILIVCGIPLLVVILLARYLLKNKRDNTRLRLEVGKLAQEVDRLRQNLQQTKENDGTPDAT
jgi:hypothetical protein